MQRVTKVLEGDKLPFIHLTELGTDLEREDRELQEELDRRDEADAGIGAALSSCATRSVIASL